MGEPQKKSLFQKICNMTTNPGFSVRFYIRPPRKGISDTPTPLRLKVWISATKGYLYLSTNAAITPRQFSAFAADGTPSQNADPQLTKIVDTYRAAVQLVISGAIVNGKIATLTSKGLESRVAGVIGRMEANAKGGVWHPITPFADPLSVQTCAECLFCGHECRAPWLYEFERERAAEVADYNGICINRSTRTPKGIMWQPNPKREPEPFDKDKQSHLITAIDEAEKGGRNG